MSINNEEAVSDEPEKMFTYWQAWRRGAEEARGEDGLSWEGDYYWLSEAYDEGRDYARRALGLD